MDSIDEQIFENLKEIANRLFILKKRIALRNGLSLCEANILCIVASCEPIMQSRLGELGGIDKPATSRVVNKLLCSGLIEKFNKEDNKKNIFIRLSQPGVDLSNKMRAELCVEKANFFKLLSHKDKEIALKLSSKVLS